MTAAQLAQQAEARRQRELKLVEEKDKAARRELDERVSHTSHGIELVLCGAVEWLHVKSDVDLSIHLFSCVILLDQK